MSNTFAARLNRLFDTVYPPGRGPHTSAEVIAALKAEGVTMSAPYLSQLRSGNRTNPSATTMTAKQTPRSAMAASMLTFSISASFLAR